MRVLDRLDRFRAVEEARGSGEGRVFPRESAEQYYVVYPGSEKLDIGDRKAVTITRNRQTAYLDVGKYGKFGEVVIVDKEGLLKIIEEW